MWDMLSLRLCKCMLIVSWFKHLVFHLLTSNKEVAFEHDERKLDSCVLSTVKMN